MQNTVQFKILQSSNEKYFAEITNSAMCEGIILNVEEVDYASSLKALENLYPYVIELNCVALIK